MIPPAGARHYLLDQSIVLVNGVHIALNLPSRSAQERFAVNLSSMSAQHARGTGPIVGLHNQERKLDRVVLVPSMCVLGVLTLFDFIRRAQPDEGPEILLVGDLEILFLFMSLTVWGLLARRDPSSHKRHH